MSYTLSNMLSLGTKAPDFSMIDTVSDEIKNFESIKGEKGTVVMFICNHCPYVIHVNPEIVTIAIEYFDLDIGFVGISSNDVENYPQDSPENMKIHANEAGYPFPYLYDESQSVAREYAAACTPDFYIFDANDELVYRGQMDSSRPGMGELNGIDLRISLDKMLVGETVSAEQRPSGGCNIKWKQ